MVDAFSQFYAYFVLFLFLYVVTFVDFVLWQNKCMLVTVRLALKNIRKYILVSICIQSN